MRKVVSLVLLFSAFFCGLVLAAEMIKGPLPEKVPPPEKCAGCHDIQKTYQELLLSSHKDLQCSECHIPGSIQKGKYERKELSFQRLGYHEKDGMWAEVPGNQVCLRCHESNGIKDTKQSCWACHMPEIGKDKVVFVKDKALPPTGENIGEVKEMDHKSHAFKMHPGAKAEK